MATEYSSQSYLAHHAKVPGETRQAVIEQLVTDESARLRQVGQDGSKLKRIKEEHREQLLKIVGAEKYGQIREYVAQQKKAQAQRLLPPRGPETPKEVVLRQRQQRNESAQAFLRNLGVDPAQLKALNKQTRDRIAPAPVREGRPLLPADVPAEILEGKANPWTVVRPPYPGWAWWYNGWLAGFSFSPTLYLDSAAGLVGNNNYLSDSDASDFDAGNITYNATVGFWYHMPSTGLIEVWVEAQCASNHHHVSLYDEWGWSDSFAYQYDYIVMKADGATSDEWRLNTMSSFYESGYTDGYWDNHYLTNGGTYWSHLYSDASFPAGNWVWVQVGTRTYNNCFANDVEVYSNPLFKWFLKSVWIESTGG